MSDDSSAPDENEEADPTEPADPTDPADLADPADSTDLVDPADPEDLVDPAELDDLADLDDLDDLIERLHAELEATEGLPVERSAGRWIGEAQAVAGDAASGGLPETVVRERVGHVRELLGHVEETGSEAADEHVDRASALALRITGDS